MYAQRILANDYGWKTEVLIGEIKSVVLKNGKATFIYKNGCKSERVIGEREIRLYDEIPPLPDGVTPGSESKKIRKL